MRHAIAHERGDRWPDDDKRPLTREGAARMRQVVAGLRALDPRLDVVVTSPLVRAAQTAAILVRGLSPRPRLVTADTLAPGHSPAKVVRMLAGVAAERVALVGHEPDMGELAAWLLGARQAPPFKKGSVCRIDIGVWPPSAGSGALVWMATPKMLRAMAGS